MGEVFLDAFIDSLKVLAVLLPINFLITFLEPRLAGKIKLKGKFAPLVGVSVGLFPQCGFSVVATDLYQKRHITAVSRLRQVCSLPYLRSFSVTRSTLLSADLFSQTRYSSRGLFLLSQTKVGAALTQNSQSPRKAVLLLRSGFVSSLPSQSKAHRCKKFLQSLLQTKQPQIAAVFACLYILSIHFRNVKHRICKLLI